MKYEPEYFEESLVETQTFGEAAKRVSQVANRRLMAELKSERERLHADWKEVPNKNKNHLATLIMGQINFIDRWLEEVEG